MKLKYISATLLSVLLICILAVPVSAAAANPGGTAAPMYTIAQGPYSDLYINGTSAYCDSSTGSSGAVSITVVQTLQKHKSWLSWEDVSDASWSKTVSASSITASNSKSGLESGKYRLKSVFTLENSAGTIETVTIYSSEQTVS